MLYLCEDVKMLCWLLRKRVFEKIYLKKSI